jgi:hypothetical protein
VIHLVAPTAFVPSSRLFAWRTSLAEHGPSKSCSA